MKASSHTPPDVARLTRGTPLERCERPIHPEQGHDRARTRRGSSEPHRARMSPPVSCGPWCQTTSRRSNETRSRPSSQGGATSFGPWGRRRRRGAGKDLVEEHRPQRLGAMVGRGARRLHRASRCPQAEELTASDRPRSFARGETTSARSRPSEGRRGSPPWHLPCSDRRSD